MKNITITKTPLSGIRSMRGYFLNEVNFQVRYNACHERGWSDSYLIRKGRKKIGYGSVKGLKVLNDRDTVFEFFIREPFGSDISEIFSMLLASCKAKYIECQSNDQLLTSLLYEFCRDIYADVILYKDGSMTDLVSPGVVFREKRPEDRIFRHDSEPPGDYVLERHGEVVATGGYMVHYNEPYADLYMEVRKDCMRQGMGSYLLQEIRKLCLVRGLIPAARCAIRNHASRNTLRRSGLAMAGFMLTGKIDCR